jgi:hypothetical protein
MPTLAKETEWSSCSTSSVAGKGHFVVYSADGRRFEVPLVYLSTTVFLWTPGHVAGGVRLLRYWRQDQAAL